MTDTITKVCASASSCAARNGETVSLDTTLEDLQADSLDRIAIIMELEAVFEIEIKDDDAPDLSASMTEWAQFIDRAKGGAK